MQERLDFLAMVFYLKTEERSIFQYIISLFFIVLHCIEQYNTRHICIFYTLYYFDIKCTNWNYRNVDDVTRGKGQYETSPIIVLCDRPF